LYGGIFRGGKVALPVLAGLVLARYGVCAATSAACWPPYGGLRRRLDPTL